MLKLTVLVITPTLLISACGSDHSTVAPLQQKLERTAVTSAIDNQLDVSFELGKSGLLDQQIEGETDYRLGQKYVDGLGMTQIKVYVEGLCTSEFERSFDKYFCIN